MDATLASLALAGGLAWASGLRLYLVILLLGLLGRTGWMNLPPDLEVLAHPYVLAASGIMAAAEFLADKVPGFDSAWDSVHTLIRIPAGALLAAGAVGAAGPDSAATLLAAGLLGGMITAGTHLTKAGTRVAINHSPEPVSNWVASLTEDLLAPGIVGLALVAPLVLLVLLGFAILAGFWLLPRLWRLITSVLRRLRP